MRGRGLPGPRPWHSYASEGVADCDYTALWDVTRPQRRPTGPVDTEFCGIRAALPWRSIGRPRHVRRLGRQHALVRLAARYGDDRPGQAEPVPPRARIARRRRDRRAYGGASPIAAAEIR